MADRGPSIRCTSPTAIGWDRKVLRSRYKIIEDQVLGQGGIATVYKGLDVEACKNVAVKMYSTEPGDASGLNSFVESVKVLQAITGDALFKNGLSPSSSRRGSFMMDNDFGAYYETMQKEKAERSQKAYTSENSSLTSVSAEQPDKTVDFFDVFDVRNCFVKLLDYSKTEDGEPGMDEEDEALWLVFEVGQESLADVLEQCKEQNTPMKQQQLRDLQWTLVSIVWGLHAAGYVHLDIKPQNIMKFPVPGQEQSQWKLIDLDGAVQSGKALNLGLVTFTPEYMPPELANAMINAPNDPLITSRLMDVWSVGMCAMEAIFLQPVLGPFYDTWMQETGDSKKFFEFLSKYDADPIVEGDMKDYISSINEDMAELLGCMLAKDPAKRYCIGQCLAHKWFDPVRSEIMGRGMLESERSGAGAKGGVKSRLGGSGRRGSMGAKACAVM